MKAGIMLLAVSFFGLLMLSCGHQPTGACVRGSGIAANCGDDFTAAQCNTIGGTAFYQGQTCKQLGLSARLARPAGLE
jgi:hypothetical protein